MKISYNWLREYLTADIPALELPKHLLFLGFEVSDMQSTGPGFSGVVVGEILDVQKHPNADRLSLCSVNNGKEKLSIVCGAKNVAVGARVPVAQIGAVLPGGHKIEKTKIRGTESQGMICSATELGLAEKNGEGILILPSDTPIGEDASKLLGESDSIMEVEVTPNRPDCLSHYGLARELSVYFRTTPRPPSAVYGTSAAGPAPDPSIAARRIDIASPNDCLRYLGRDFKDLTIGPSPAWIVKRLEAVGLKSINNLVDITNYVLFEVGHPLHAFDADKLGGNQITVRFAKAGEKLEALDGKTYALSAANLVIADASQPTAIAGVIGGQPSSVGDKTKNAFLESACFKPGVVRKSSKSLKIRTDSSYRFERGTDPESAAWASARATELILQLCKGKPGALGDTYPEKDESAPIEVTSARINQILGTDHPADKVDGVLHRISPQSTPKNGRFLFFPPPYRKDLTTVWDLAEEVARHLGYDSIPSNPAAVKIQRPKSTPLIELLSLFRNRLKAQGFSEAYNMEFVSSSQLNRLNLTPEKAAVAGIFNPLSEDYAYLRPTLLIGLLQSAFYNFSRGTKNIRLFEAGHTYTASGTEMTERSQIAGIMTGSFPVKTHWDTRLKPTDFYDAKGALSDLVRAYPQISWSPLNAEANVFFHPKASLELHLSERRLGIVGMLHPRVLSAWDMGTEPAAAFVLEDLEMLSSLETPDSRVKPISPYPSVTRDISIVLDESIAYGQIESALKSVEHLQVLDLIDVYTGTGIPPGKKSFTLRLTLTRQDRTFKDEEVAKLIENALAALSKDFGAQLRQ